MDDEYLLNWSTQHFIFKVKMECIAMGQGYRRGFSVGPEQIAGWLKSAPPGEERYQVSHETIYRSLFVHPDQTHRLRDRVPVD